MGRGGAAHPAPAPAAAPLHPGAAVLAPAAGGAAQRRRGRRPRQGLLPCGSPLEPLVREAPDGPEVAGGANGRPGAARTSPPVGRRGRAPTPTGPEAPARPRARCGSRVSQAGSVLYVAWQTHPPVRCAPPAHPAVPAAARGWQRRGHRRSARPPGRRGTPGFLRLALSVALRLRFHSGHPFAKARNTRRTVFFLPPTTPELCFSIPHPKHASPTLRGGDRGAAFQPVAVANQTQTLLTKTARKGLGGIRNETGGGETARRSQGTAPRARGAGQRNEQRGRVLPEGLEGRAKTYTPHFGKETGRLATLSSQDDCSAEHRYCLGTGRVTKTPTAQTPAFRPSFKSISRPS